MLRLGYAHNSVSHMRQNPFHYSKSHQLMSRCTTHVECPPVRIVHYLTMCTDGCQAAEYSGKAAMAINNIRMRSYYSFSHLSDNFHHSQRIERLPHICDITGISTVFQFVEINRMRANDRLLNSFFSLGASISRYRSTPPAHSSICNILIIQYY